MQFTVNLTRPRPLVYVLLSLAFVLPLVLSAPAGAQGTSGTLPDPISTRELMRYADRLGLSDQQRRAVEGLHDEYRESFRELREGDIQQFLLSMRKLQSGGGMPQRAVVEEFFKDMSRITGKIVAIDDRLLSRIQGVCTDEQLGSMHRVRMARERARFNSQEMMTMSMMGRAIVDISEIILDVEMSPEEREVIDAMLSSYESRLTNRMNALHRSSIDMFLAMFDAMERMGFTEEPNDPEEMERMMEAVQSVMMEIMAASMVIGKEMRELNRRTFANLSGALSPRPARALRNAYIGRAYSDVAPWLTLPVLGQMESALTFENLTEQQRSAIQAQEFEVRTKLDRIVNELVDLVDAFHDDFAGMWDFEGDRWMKHHEAMQQISGRAQELQQSATEFLKATLGEEELQRAVAEAASAPTPVPGRAVPPPVDPIEQEEAQREARGSDWFLAGAISPRDLPVYSRMLDLSADQRAVLEDLHASYLEQFAEATKEPLAKLAAAIAEHWSEDAGDDSVNRIYQIRAETRAIIDDADARFFEDIALVLTGEPDDPGLARVKLMREREVNARGVSQGHTAESRSALIDLSRIIRSYGLTDGELESVDAILLEYERELAEALKRRYENALARQRAEDLWNREMRVTRSINMRNQVDMRERYAAIMGDAQTQFADSMRAVAELNDRTLEKLLAALHEDRSIALRDGYRRRAFPSVYRDLAAMDGHLRTAMLLEDLTPDQRSRLNEMAAEYRARYARMSERMIELNASQHSRHNYEWLTQDEDYWVRYMERQDEMSRVRFDRNELNARAITGLRSLLSPDQLRQLGELPEPPGVERYGSF